jgi:hypothetical protein
MVPSVTSAIILLPFLATAQHESGTRKTKYILVSDPKKNKLSSQCYLTAPTKPVQDKIYYF